MDKTQEALKKTMNFTVYQDGNLIGCLRILTDGYYFGTITELLRLAKIHTPTLLYFGAQPEAEAFYEKNGCKRGMQSYVIEKE